MNTVIIGAIALSLITIAIIVSLQARKNQTDKILAKHGLSEHKARQALRAQEMSSNQDLFAK